MNDSACSVTGRITILKMNVLLMLSLAKTFFCHLQKNPTSCEIHILIKKQKFVCLCYTCLVIVRGQKCPSLLLYHYAAQLRSIMFYLSTDDIPHWAHVEPYGLKLALPVYLLSDTMKKLQKQTGHL